MAGKRFCAAKANSQLRHLQRVQEAEAFSLSALDKDGEGAACAAAMAIKNVLLARIIEEG